MAYAILRFQKCKSLTQIRGIIKHNLREIPVVTEGGTITKIYTAAIRENQQRYKTYSEFFKAKTENIKLRKDCVKMVETITTFLPGGVPEERLYDWAKDTVDYLIGLFGEENIYCITLFISETFQYGTFYKIKL